MQKPINSQSEAQGFDLVLKPVSGWWNVDLRALWKYRDLIRMFVHRDFVAQYKQTILGPLWFVIQPVLSTIVFTIIFGRIARIPTDGIPQFLFYFSGTLAWGYFSNCLTTTSNTFIGNANIFGKVYFPRLCVPIANVISNLLSFALQLSVFTSLYLLYIVKGAHIQPTLAVMLLPLFVLQMALLGLGFGILISSLTTKYRDLTFLVNFGVQLWMYGTPIVYPLSVVPDHLRVIMLLNPMSVVVEGFRMAFFGSTRINLHEIVLGWGITGLVLFAGVMLFSKIEKSFMDTV